MNIKLIKKQLAVMLSIALLASLLSGCAGTPLSEEVIGEWYGQADVAKWAYKDLSDELGIELSPEPAYCDVTLTFNEDGSYILKIDQESFASAAGQCAEPYVSALFGVDTDWLVELIMQYAAQDMPADCGEECGTYEVDDEALTVDLVSEYESLDTLTLNSDGQLELEEESINQTIVFEKVEE